MSENKNVVFQPQKRILFCSLKPADSDVNHEMDVGLTAWLGSTPGAPIDNQSTLYHERVFVRIVFGEHFIVYRI